MESEEYMPPQYGYSQDALVSRRMILQAACETLANRSSRRDYNLGLAGDEIGIILTQVPWDKIDLFAATPSNIPAESSEVYRVALALVAQAFVDKKPHLIQDADNHFQQLQQTKGDPEIDFALERGLCSLLVGEVDQCRTWLGLDSESSPYRDPSIVNLVLERPKDDQENDMLPGLCKLLETWLMEVVFPRFRETQDIQFKLGDYYDNPTVLKYLERLEGVSGSPLAAAASIAIIGADVTAVLDSVKYGALQALQKVFPLGPSERSVKTDEEYEIINSEVSGESEELTRPNQSDNSTNTGLISDRQKSDDLLEQELITEEIKEASVKIMRAGVAVGLFALFGLKFIPIRNDMPTMVSDVINVEESVDEEDAETSRMDARLVGNLIRTWQNIKSQAVGPDHCLGKLLEILDGEMLKSWTERGAEIAEHGWFWQYTLLNLNIDSFC